MTALRVKVTKLDLKGFAKAAIRERRGAVKGLRDAAEHVLGGSQDIVPFEEGILQGTGGTDVDEGDLAASVYYDTVYAARQHEETTWRHDPGRQAKYLESVVDGEQAVIKAVVAAAIRRELRS